MNYDALKILLDVYRTRNFASVAEERGVAPSSISRAVAGLEEELGIRMFQRTTRRLSPTEAGAAYMDRIAPLMEEFDAAREQAVELSEGPKGKLRITASTSFGQISLAPLLAVFCDTFPNISLELILSDRQLDLVDERIDVALRHGTLRDSSMISRKLMDVKYKLVASPQYLSARRDIKTPEDLMGLDFLTFPFEGFRDHWKVAKENEEMEVKVEPRLLVSNAAALKELAVEGVGIALLADWTVTSAIDEGTLIEVLPEWSVIGTPGDGAIWIVYPSRNYVPSKTRAFIDFLGANFRTNTL